MGLSWYVYGTYLYLFVKVASWQVIVVKTYKYLLKVDIEIGTQSNAFSE